jgi:hypothetical protein
MSNLLVQNIKHTNNTTAQTIDSTGRILTPARPAFRARIAGSSSAHGDQGVLVFETEDFDIGGNYDTSNGRFTAPIAGIYWFAFNIITATNATGGTPTAGDSVAVRFIKNGSDIAGTLGYSMINANYQIVLNSIHIFQLSASDYIQVNVSSEFAYSDGTAVNDPTFQGYLIG